MYKIGEFAKLCKTTSKTLRFYDSAGILKPDYIDSSTGYRYYYRNKIAAYYKIMSLKNIGCTIEEIHTHFMNATEEEIIALLSKKESELLTAYTKCSEMKRQYEQSLDMCKKSKDLNIKIIDDPINRRLRFTKNSEENELLLDDKDTLPCMQMLDELINGDTIVNVDYADLCLLLNKKNSAFFISFHVKNDELPVPKIIKHADSIKNSVMLIRLSKNKTLKEVSQILNLILAGFTKDTLFLWGASIDDELENEYFISMINFY